MLGQLLVNDVSGMHMLCDHMLNSLDKTKAAVFWKNKKSQYLGVNNAFLNCAGVQSHDDVIGKTDLDLRWGKYATAIMENDSKVVYTGIPRKFIELCRIGDDDYYVNYKKPLLSRSGKIVGIFGMAVPLKNPNLLFNDGIEFTKRQTDCIQYLVQGKTAKEIARILQISHRTVEHYLEAVKVKLNCNSKSELIEKVIKNKNAQLLLTESLESVFHLICV